MPPSAPCTCQKIWESEGLPVLHACVDLPSPEGHRRIRAFYDLQSKAYLRYCRRFLLPEAKTALRRALEDSHPFSPWEAELSWQETYREGSLLSLCLNSREAGAELYFHRRGDTWDLATGTPVPLSHFLPGRWRRLFYETAAAETERRIRCGNLICREDWRSCLRRNLNPRSFYLTQEGLTFYLPMYTLGPSAPFIPTFTVPWSVLRAQ